MQKKKKEEFYKIAEKCIYKYTMNLIHEPLGIK